MTNHFVLGELANSRQHELRQEAKYAAQLRQLSFGSRPVSIKSHRKWAVALGAAVLMAVLAALSNGVAI